MFDHVGGPSLRSSYAMLRPGGLLLSYGNNSASKGTGSVWWLVSAKTPSRVPARGAARRVWHDRRVLSAISTVPSVMSDLVAWLGLIWRPRKSLEAEILFLRRQLAVYTERGVRPRRIDAATRASLVLLSRLFEWR